MALYRLYTNIIREREILLWVTYYANIFIKLN